MDNKTIVQSESFIYVVLFLTIISSGLFLSLVAFEWSATDMLTVFFYPTILSIALTLFAASAAINVIFTILVLSNTKRVKNIKETNRLMLVPIGISIVTFLLVWLVPFKRIWLDIDFNRYKSEREKVVKEFYVGKIKPSPNNPRYIELDSNYPPVSVGGNEVLIENHKGQKCLLFFTLKGALDNYAGFIYVPKDNLIMKNDYMKYDIIDLKPRGDHWYYVSLH
jgi:hypothetical protein